MHDAIALFPEPEQLGLSAPLPLTGCLDYEQWRGAAANYSSRERNPLPFF